MNINGKAKLFWEAFLAETKRPPDTAYYECFHFDNNEASANELLALVLAGKKMATASSLTVVEAEGNRMPRVGDLSIVTDWDGNPHCVIETTAVMTLPFRDMTYDICKREGEDDTLSSWREGHTRFFQDEGKQYGFAFSEDMPIVFEDFKVIYRLCDITDSRKIR